MAEGDLHHIEKLLPYKTKPKSHSYIQDGDLQIHIPNVKDASNLDPSINFRSIYSNFLSEAGKVQPEAFGTGIGQGDDLKLAMEEAKSAFNSMMEIREQLNQAYREFMQM